MDRKLVVKAAETLAKLTAGELEAFVSFFYLDDVQSPEERSWRARSLAAAALLARVDRDCLHLVSAMARRDWSSYAGAHEIAGTTPITPFEVEGAE